MTVRITVGEPASFRRIAVEGRLSADAVHDLEREVGDHPDEVVLDLANLRSADAAGVAALRRLRAEGVAMQRTGLHLAWRIDEAPGHGDESRLRDGAEAGRESAAPERPDQLRDRSPMTRLG